MKVDKGVCTSNDEHFSGNSVTNELNSIAKFETVFTTLVENKILAIKRECEQHECKRKSRSLKGILLRKANITANDVIAITEETIPNDAIGSRSDKKEIVERKKKRRNFFAKYYQKSKTVDIEGGQNRTSEICDELVNVVIVQNDNNIDDLEQGLRTYKRSDAKLDSFSKDLKSPISCIKLKSKVIADVAIIEENKPNCDKPIIDSIENAQVTLSTTKISSNIFHNRKHQINFENDESLATTIDLSLQQSSAIVTTQKNISTTKTVPTNKNIKNISIKSDVAICDDVSSQNTSDIEFSLASENSLNELPLNIKNDRSSNANAISDPVFKKTSNVFSSLLRDNNETDRKASSCQSTPIFKRHMLSRNESEVKKNLTFNKEFPNFFSKTIESKIDSTLKSQTIVIAPTSNTITTTLAKPTVTSISSNLPQEIVHTSSCSKKGQKHSKKLHDVSLEYEITYDGADENQSPHGFISSFNQLTSQKHPSAIISANLKKHANDQHQDGDTTTQHDTKVEYLKAINNQDVELNDLEMDLNETKKKKRRQKRYSRKVDSTVFPSTSVLKQQCILSKPPNQLIQIQCESGLVYDASLQAESEFNGEIKSIVPAEQKKNRHKHRHDHEQCRKKRRKRKILVHNLDDKSLKVIDPDSDELPQRAKFTIVATACLLLIMCLLLVGVTLRMAPLIDDMAHRHTRGKFLKIVQQHQQQHPNFHEVDAFGEDFVDFGASTGHQGQFSWHADFPIE